MLFNSLQFLLFFLVVYGLYLVLPHRKQNRMLLVASCIFYGAWDWRFLSLIFISAGIDYWCALCIESSADQKIRRRFVTLSIVTNLGILGFFKYYDFFISSLQALLANFGVVFEPRLLHVVLPVGISFYTFQAMSYTLDVYRRRLNAARDFPDFMLYVTFFPQLVAGPIERAAHLLPQVLSPRKVTLDGFYSGAYLIFWGLFQKVFIADNLAKIVEPIFDTPGPYSGGQVLVGMYAFAFQILCDFSGYSNIARGLGKLMGFDIMVNFNLPYFSMNPQDFWRRWHISLSTWLKDYLYIPLGGNRLGTLLTCRNLMLVMVLGGLWHGAKWTFVVWGAYHGLLLIAHRLALPWLEKIPHPKTKFGAYARIITKMTGMFHLVCLGWIFFRADSLSQAEEMLNALFWNFSITPEIYFAGLSFLFFAGILIAVQCWQYVLADLTVILRAPVWFRAAFYTLCYYLIVIFGVTNGRQFIYFQF